MKKICGILMIIVLMLSFDYVFANESENKDVDMIDSIDRLEQFDIVRNALDKWDESSTITRYDALSMAYVIKTRSREYNYDKNKSLSELKARLDQCYIVRDWRYDFCDIEEGSDDYYFAMSMYIAYLLKGEEVDGNLYANLYDEITYDEALNIIFNIFIEVDDEYLLQPYTSDTPYFEMAERTNLINSRIFTDTNSPQLAKENLNNKISAYEYMDILYRSLYLLSPKQDADTAYCEGGYIEGYLEKEVYQGRFVGSKIPGTDIID